MKNRRNARPQVSAAANCVLVERSFFIVGPEGTMGGGTPRLQTNADGEAWRSGARKSTAESRRSSREQENAEIGQRNIPPPDLRTGRAKNRIESANILCPG